MPVVAAAVCPHPPVIVPQVAAGAAHELADLRAACRAALDTIAASCPDALITVGVDDGLRHRGLGAYGASGVVIGSDTAAGLPLSLLVGEWLVNGGAGGERTGGELTAGERTDGERTDGERTGGEWTGGERTGGERTGGEQTGGEQTGGEPAIGSRAARAELATLDRSRVLVAPDATRMDCLDLGRVLARSAERVALLIMGDGSARRTEKAPRYLHPDAEAFDARVAAALASADAGALAALDPDLAAEVAAPGRAAWQVLAGAAETGSWRGELNYDAAPYGVGYFVATWLAG